MGIGFFLTLHITSLVVVVWWLRGLVLRRLRPERVLSDLRDEVRTLVAEIDHAGDQQVGLIEDRARQAGELRQRLDALIEEATRQVFALDRGVSEARAIRQPQTPVDTDLDVGAVSARPEPVAPPSRDPASSVPAHETQTPPDVTHLDPREAVQVLTSAGLSLDLIAMHTGLAKGEVELIVSLAQSGARGPDDA